MNKIGLPPLNDIEYNHFEFPSIYILQGNLNPSILSVPDIYWYSWGHTGCPFGLTFNQSIMDDISGDQHKHHTYQEQYAIWLG